MQQEADRQKKDLEDALKQQKEMELKKIE